MEHICSFIARTNFVRCVSEANTRLFLSTLLASDHSDSCCQSTTRCTPPLSPSLHAHEPFCLQFRALERQARQQRQLIILDECDRLQAWADGCMQRLLALPFYARAAGLSSSASPTQLRSSATTLNCFCFNASTQSTSCRPSCRRCSSRAARLPPCTSLRNPPAILNSMFFVPSLHDPTPPAARRIRCTSCCAAGCRSRRLIAVALAFLKNGHSMFARENALG